MRYHLELILENKRTESIIENEVASVYLVVTWASTLKRKVILEVKKHFLEMNSKVFSDSRMKCEIC